VDSGVSLRVADMADENEGGLLPFAKAALEKKTGKSKHGGGLLGSIAHMAHVPGFKKGGKVKKTGIYKLHKGERVIPASKSHPSCDI
jgi:hypothetical protein